MGFHNNETQAEKLSTRQIVSLMSFRKPREVLNNENKWASTACICPTCKTPINMEFVRYCSHCGQRLKWRKFYKAEVTKEVVQELILINFKRRNYPSCERNKIRRGLLKLVHKYRDL